MCANVRERTWRRFNSEKKSSWRCFVCKAKNSEKVEMSNESLASTIRKIMKEENLELIKKMNEYHDAIEFYRNQFDAYIKDMKALSEENKWL